MLAGPVQPGQERYFHEQVEPHVDGDRVQYVGKITGTAKKELFANAAALLMPIRWREPFGRVMVEALAAAAAVISFPKGAAAEIVIDGENGMLVTDETEMASAVTHLDAIDPARCRATVANRYDPATSAARYEHVYRQSIHTAAQSRTFAMRNAPATVKPGSDRNQTRSPGARSIPLRSLLRLTDVPPR
jgi:glycosyltransferase involved in cell wall biosynthesis